MTETSSNLPQWTEPDGLMHISRNPPIQGAEVNRRFIPPSIDTKPSDIFSLQYNRCALQATRYIANNDRGTVLLYAGGATYGTGQNDIRAGFGVVFRAKHNISARLERPSGDNKATVDRATLRAVLCALQMRSWDGEGFDRVVVAVNSEYVVVSACDRLPTWSRRNWKSGSKKLIRNKDLWEKLLDRMTTLEQRGVQVQFWHIPQESNIKADAHARQGAFEEEYEEFKAIMVLDI